MNTRLMQFLAAENISQAQLADSLNVARSGISHIVSNRSKPSYDFITALMARYPRLNIEWLLLGKGKMYKDDVQSIHSATPQTPASSDIADEKNTDSQLSLFPQMSHQTEVQPENGEEIHVQMHGDGGNIPFSNEITACVQQVQRTVKQRSVSKIVIMFDDGSYQEIQNLNEI